MMLRPSRKSLPLGSALFLLAALVFASCQKGEEEKQQPAKKAPRGHAEVNASGNQVDCPRLMLWSGSQFTLAPACAQASGPAAEAKRIRIKFAGSRGDEVPGYLYLPAHREGERHPAIYLQYGLGGSKDNSTIGLVADRLIKEGFVVMVIDVPGRGDRKGAAGGKITNITTVLDHDLFRWYLGDYAKAIEFLLARPEVDTERLGYIGASWGAITGVPYVAREPRIKTMVSVVGGGGFFGIVPPDLDPASNVARIAPRPLLLINARQDQVVLQPFGEALQAAAGQGAEKVWLNTDHTLSGIDVDKLALNVVKFLRQALKIPTR